MTARNKRKSKALVLLLLLIALIMIGYSACQLRQISQVYEEGDQSYELLKEQVKSQGRVNENESGTADKTDDSTGSVNAALADRKVSVQIPSLSVDLGALQEVNEDSVAWLYCPDTVIDYPVMRADDYDWYLHHLPDGTKNANGTLFLDYNCPADFSGRLSIIYGHNMKSGKMFGSLTKYKNQKYFDEHSYMYLYTEQGNYRIDLVYGSVIGANVWRDRAFMYEINLEALLTYASSKTTFVSTVEYTDDARFIVLSTCSYEFDDARYIVVGVLQPEFGA